MTNLELIGKWQAAGLLDKFEKPSVKIKASLILEDIYKKMNSIPSWCSYNARVDVIIFPVTVRIIENILNSDREGVDAFIAMLDAEYILEKTHSMYDDVNNVFTKHIQSTSLNVENFSIKLIAEIIAQEYMANFKIGREKYNELKSALSKSVENMYLGEYETIPAIEFEHGLKSYDFNLGPNSQINKQQSAATLKFLSKTNIYYKTNGGNVLVTAAGGGIPFFSQVQAWTQGLYENNIANVVLDVRIAGIYGTDFDVNQLNDGEGNFGEAFKIEAAPSYQIF